MQELLDAIGAVRPMGKRPVISVCGLGGSGKSTLCAELAKALNGFVIQTDWYLRYPTVERKIRIASALESGDPERRDREENPLNWYDWEHYSRDLSELRTTGILTLTDAWNQRTGAKDEKVEIRDQSLGAVICDGIYLLHPPVVDLSDVTVLLQVSPHFARERADARDAHRSDSAYLAYKAELQKRYDLPYLSSYMKAANFVLSVNGSGRLEVLRNSLFEGDLER